MGAELFAAGGDNRPHASGVLDGELLSDPGPPASADTADGDPADAETADDAAVQADWGDVWMDWLVDLGSQLTCVRASTAAPFAWVQTNAVGQLAYGTNGGAAIPMGYGPSVVVHGRYGPDFVYQDWLGVKQTDSGSDLIGTDFLEFFEATVVWDAGALQGSIRVG